MKRRTLVLLSLWLMLALGCQMAYSALGLTTPTPAKQIVSTLVPTATPRPAESMHMLVFAELCDLVQENYVYPDFNGLDWDAECEAMTPRVVAAPDDESFYTLMREMIDDLGDDHSYFLSPQEAEEEDEAWFGTLDYVGVGVYVQRVDDKPYAVVLFPMPGGPAEAAGIRPRDRILEIDGVPACCNADGSDNFDHMLGKEGTEVRLLVQTPGEAPHEMTLTRAAIRMQMPILSHRFLTPQGDIGYLLIPSLDDSTLGGRTRKALRALLDEGPLAGLVLDLRPNYGGEYRQLLSILSLFTEGEGGYFLTRGGERRTLTIEADPIDGSQTMPLAVLIGPDTVSYAEVLAAVLQWKGRAVLVGAPTEGNVETLHAHELADGSRLWLAEEAFFLPNGHTIEGVGLQPDLPVLADDWATYPLEEDPQITAALHWLEAQIGAGY